MKCYLGLAICLLSAESEGMREASMDPLTGAWRLVAIQFGEHEPVKPDKQTYYTFQDGVLTIRTGEEKTVWKYRLDLSRKLAWIVWTEKDGHTLKDYAGIFKIAGDECTLYYTPESKLLIMPTDFESASKLFRWRKTLRHVAQK